MTFPTERIKHMFQTTNQFWCVFWNLVEFLVGTGRFFWVGVWVLHDMFTMNHGGQPLTSLSYRRCWSLRIIINHLRANREQLTDSPKVPCRSDQSLDLPSCWQVEIWCFCPHGMSLLLVICVGKPFYHIPLQTPGRGFTHDVHWFAIISQTPMILSGSDRYTHHQTVTHLSTTNLVISYATLCDLTLEIPQSYFWVEQPKKHDYHHFCHQIWWDPDTSQWDPAPQVNWASHTKENVTMSVGWRVTASNSSQINGANFGRVTQNHAEPPVENLLKFIGSSSRIIHDHPWFLRREVCSSIDFPLPQLITQRKKIFQSALQFYARNVMAFTSKNPDTDQNEVIYLFEPGSNRMVKSPIHMQKTRLSQHHPRFPHMFQYVPIVPICSNMFQCVSIYSNVFQYIPMCFNIFQCVWIYSNVFQYIPMCFNIFQCVSKCSNMFQYVPICFLFILIIIIMIMIMIMTMTIIIIIIIIIIIPVCTAQGGGGSFKDRKPIGEVRCCESWMAEQIHWWIEKWLEAAQWSCIVVEM